MTPTAPYCLLEDRREQCDRLFHRPRAVLLAQNASELPGLLRKMEDAQASGFYLAGYFGYECGYALEPRLLALSQQRHTGPHGASNGPIAQFGVFDAPEWVERSAEGAPAAPLSTQLDLAPLWDFEAYRRRFDQAMAYIHAGDVYQINLTFPFLGAFTPPSEAFYSDVRSRDDALALYRHFRLRQPVSLGGVVNFGGPTLISLSPEMFFDKIGDYIQVEPMKGTAPRGATPEQDAVYKAALSANAKSRAENLMIVDLLRNDLSRLSAPGSVQAQDLYHVATYPTLHQMTSRVVAQLVERPTLSGLLTALFPCGSVTGAPKIRAMEIIHELEPYPRGAYCGALGWIAPNGDMRFNVAIRTITHHPDGKVTYSVGSAVVADSMAREEYDECLLKARFLTQNCA